jgi:hypothetical protein
MPTALTTRITTGTGATVKNAPLTSTEIDNNFLSLNDNKLETTFTGSTNIVTLGTVTTGTWSATTIATTKGGTGLTSFTSGGAVYASSSSALTTGTLPVTAGGTGTATALTAGSVVFAGSSGVYSQDNSQLFYDDTNNRLGIGTATPSSKLHVVGGRSDFTASSETYALGVRFSAADGIYYIGASSSATPDLVFSQVGGTERLRLTNTGALAFSGASNYGTSGQLLQSNGNAAATWVTPTYASTGKAIAMAIVFGG